MHSAQGYQPRLLVGLTLSTASLHLNCLLFAGSRGDDPRGAGPRVPGGGSRVCPRVPSGHHPSPETEEERGQGTHTPGEKYP